MTDHVYQPPKNPLDDFDPNEKPKSPFATYCPGRRNNGAFKTHGTRASAINALHFQGTGILYTWDGSMWVEVVRFQPDSFKKTKCEHCMTSTLEDEERWDYSTHDYVATGRKYNAAVQTFVRKNGRLVEPLQVVTVCKPCKRLLSY